MLSGVQLAGLSIGSGGDVSSSWKATPLLLASQEQEVELECLQADEFILSSYRPKNSLENEPGECKGGKVGVVGGE